MLKVIAGAKDINNQGDCRQVTTVINTKTPKDFKKGSVKTDIIILILKDKFRFDRCSVRNARLPNPNIEVPGDYFTFQNNSTLFWLEI